MWVRGKEPGSDLLRVTCGGSLEQSWALKPSPWLPVRGSCSLGQNTSEVIIARRALLGWGGGRQDALGGGAAKGGGPGPQVTAPLRYSYPLIVEGSHFPSTQGLEQRWSVKGAPSRFWRARPPRRCLFRPQWRKGPVLLFSIPFRGLAWIIILRLRIPFPEGKNAWQSPSPLALTPCQSSFGP